MASIFLAINISIILLTKNDLLVNYKEFVNKVINQLDAKKIDFKLIFLKCSANLGIYILIRLSRI